MIKIRIWFQPKWAKVVNARAGGLPLLPLIAVTSIIGMSVWGVPYVLGEMAIDKDCSEYAQFPNCTSAADSTASPINESDTPLIEIIAVDQTTSSQESEVRVRLLVLYTAIGAAYLTWRRTTALERGTEIASRQLDTDRFTAAIGQMGHDSIDVRLGGIFALEHLAKARRDEYAETIDRVLIAFMLEHSVPPDNREKAPKMKSAKARAAEAFTQVRGDPPPLTVDEERKQAIDRERALVNLLMSHFRTGSDVKAAIDTLSRSRLVFHPDANKDLDGPIVSDLDLAGLTIAGLKLGSAQVSGLGCNNLRLGNTQFDNAVIENTEFVGSILYRVSFNNSKLTKVNFSDANLIQVDFSGSVLRSCFFTEAAILYADFSDATLIDCSFMDMRFGTIILRGMKWPKGKPPYGLPIRQHHLDSPHEVRDRDGNLLPDLNMYPDDEETSPLSGSL